MTLPQQETCFQCGDPDCKKESHKTRGTNSPFANHEEPGPASRPPAQEAPAIPKVFNDFLPLTEFGMLVREMFIAIHDSAQMTEQQQAEWLKRLNAAARVAETPLPQLAPVAINKAFIELVDEYHSPHTHPDCELCRLRDAARVAAPPSRDDVIEECGFEIEKSWEWMPGLFLGFHLRFRRELAEDPERWDCFWKQMKELDVRAGDGWIPVEERLPEFQLKSILLFENGWRGCGALIERRTVSRIATARFWAIEDTDGLTECEFEEVTHWRELPAPPVAPEGESK